MNKLDLFVPDRFDMLQRRAPNQLDSIVVPVDSGIERIKSLHADMRTAGRGGFLLLRGDSGSGKSTFLNTLGLFLDDVEVISISRQSSIESELRKLQPAVGQLRVIIIEGRDALGEVEPKELEAAIHEINGFIRTANGERTLLVWPINADDLETKLIEISRRVGDDSLLGTTSAAFKFSGPPKMQYVDIAQRTIGALNQGRSLADLGISDERARELSKLAPTIGRFLGLLRSDMQSNQKAVETLLSSKERCRMWIVVVAGNEPEGNISGVTRGDSSAVDINRLIRATNANVVQELKQYPEKLGLLGTFFDARILHLPMVAALAIIREFAEADLVKSITAQASSSSARRDSVKRLVDSDVGRAFRDEPMSIKSRGLKGGSTIETAFRNIAGAAAANDVLLNTAIGKALVEAKLISKFEAESNFGMGLSRVSDLRCEGPLGVVRLEIMWRQKAGRADLANYALRKLFYYGRALGYLEGRPGGPLPRPSA